MSERIIMDEAAIQRTVTRIAHEILEYNKGTEQLVLLGIKTRGEFLARRIQEKIKQIEHHVVPTGTIDITHFRDDIENSKKPITKDAIEIDQDVTDKIVIIIDDVLYTAILLHSRPIKIGLAALVDRGHRELPIRADFVGKNIPTAKDEAVSVYLEEIDDRNAVVIE